MTFVTIVLVGYLLNKIVNFQEQKNITLITFIVKLQGVATKYDIFNLCL